MCTADLVSTLESDGWTVVLHKVLSHGEGEKPDHEWIPVVTKLGYAIITSDRKMKSWNTEDGLARDAIERSGAKVFFLRGVGLTPNEQGAAINTGRKHLCRHVRQCEGTYLISRIHSVGSRMGEIQVLQRGGNNKTEAKYGADRIRSDRKNT